MDDEILKELEEQAAALQEAKKIEDDKDLDKTDDSDIKLDDEEDEDEDENCEMKESFDINTLFAGDEFSQEFKTKVSALFEAAVAGKAKQIETELTEQFVARELKLKELTAKALQESVNAEKEYAEKTLTESELLKESLEEKIDGYLDYVVEQWMETNKLALDRGIKTELFESFMSGMQKLFVEHQINVPEDKFEVLEQLREENEALQAETNKMLEENVGLKQTLKQIDRLNTIEEICEDLSDVQQEKFKELAEDLSYDTTENFRKKLEVIKENFFGNSAEDNQTQKQLTESVVTDAPMILEEEVKAPANNEMARYVKILSRSI